jgi:hypothetical protein
MRRLSLALAAVGAAAVISAPSANAATPSLGSLCGINNVTVATQLGFPGLLPLNSSLCDSLRLRHCLNVVANHFPGVFSFSMCLPQNRF